jgi:hypothetical protein
VTAPPDVRAVEDFPKSTAYRAQPGVLQVSAAAALLGYCHVSALELMGEGAAPTPAARAAYELYFTLLRAASVRVFPVPPGVVVRADGGVFVRHSSCLADSCTRIHQALVMDWEAFCTAAAQAGDRSPPAAWMHPGDVDRLCWLEETLRRVGEGGSLLHSARGAHDQALHRPRRKRQPVEAGWLAEQVQTALDHVWYALIHSRTARGTGPLWLHGPLVDESLRPSWPLDRTGR